MNFVIYTKKRGAFFLLIGIAISLLLSLYCNPTALWWKKIDYAVFRSLNNYVAGHPIQQIFWAAFSIKITDIVGALFLLGFTLLYVFEAPVHEQKKRIQELLFMLLWFEIAMILCKQLLTPFLIQHGFSRHSPTETLPNVFRLSSVLPWLKVKDGSLFSFPADHGSIVIQWCVLLWYFGSWKRGLFALIFSSIFLLPRLISGAHWLSDLCVGSVSWVLLLISLALFSPLYEYSMRLVRCIVPQLKQTKE